MRAVEEGLDEDELAIFDLLKKDGLNRPEREKSQTGQPGTVGSDQPPIGRTRPILGEGADQGRNGGIHPRRGL